MKRDIRELFKTEDEVVKNKLPQNYRQEFLDKLKSNAPNKPKKTNHLNWLKIAAVLVLLLTVGFGIFNTKNTEEQPSPLIAQIESVEKEYLENIHAEWQNFIKLTDDENLVKRYEKRLTSLDNDYQETSNSFKNDPSNILVVESLITNLQTRLQLLKDIQEHIKILNQKNEHNENTI